MDRVRAGARLVFGRCLAYGEGITFWPLREMVVAAASIERDDTPETAYAKLLECVGDADVADRLASAAGLSPRQFPLHEINWGARRFMQRLAKDGPVLAMIDDIHWAEPAFLDLIENLLDTVEDAPVLLVATSRHDLLETRAEWGQREQFDAAGAAAAVRRGRGAGRAPTCSARPDCPKTLVKRIVDAAEGNPLYVEQMLSMLVDSGASAPTARAAGAEGDRRHRRAADDPRAAGGPPRQARAHRAGNGRAGFGHRHGVSRARRCSRWHRSRSARSLASSCRR